MPDDAAALGVHRLELLQDRGDVVAGLVPGLLRTVDVLGLRVDAHQVHFGPVRGRRGPQGGQAVTGNALGPDPLLGLGFLEAVHDPLPRVGPAVLDHAVDQHAVDVVGVEHLAVAVDGLEHVLRLAGDLGLQEQLLARQSLDRPGDPIERGIALGAVEVGDAAFIGVADQVVERVLAQPLLHVAAVAAGAETEAAELQARLAERHLVHGRAERRGFGTRPGRPGDSSAAPAKAAVRCRKSRRVAAPRHGGGCCGRFGSVRRRVCLHGVRFGEDQDAYILYHGTAAASLGTAFPAAQTRQGAGTLKQRTPEYPAVGHDT